MAPEQARAFTVCAEVAEDCTRASGMGAYADGFRAAAEHIAHRIGQLRNGLPRTPLERDLRDAEVEVRTLARVVVAAERTIDELGAETAEAEGMRRLLAQFFAPGDLPQKLRPTRRSPRSFRLRGRDATG